MGLATTTGKAIVLPAPEKKPQKEQRKISLAVIGDDFLIWALTASEKMNSEGGSARRRGQRARLFHLDPIHVLLFGLLGHPACHHVELRSGPEERPAHANGTAIGYVGATIVSFWLRKNMDSRLSREKSHV